MVSWDDIESGAEAVYNTTKETVKGVVNTVTDPAGTVKSIFYPDKGQKFGPNKDTNGNGIAMNFAKNTNNSKGIVSIPGKSSYKKGALNFSTGKEIANIPKNNFQEVVETITNDNEIIDTVTDTVEQIIDKGQDTIENPLGAVTDALGIDTNMLLIGGAVVLAIIILK